MTKILVIGDLHGKMPRIHFKNFDYILCVGDICSDKGFRPIYKKWFGLIKKMGKDAPPVDEIIKEKLGENGKDILEKESLEAGRKILKYLDSFNIPVFFVPGNWDQSFGKSRIRNIDKNDYNKIRMIMDRWFNLRSNKKLLSGFSNVYDLQFGLYKDSRVNFIGYGLINNSDNFSKDIREKKLTISQRRELGLDFKKYMKRLPKLWKKRNKNVPSIFISHNMPQDIMDKSLDKKSYAYKKSLGSWVAKEFCLKQKPEVCVAGHIHEYYGKKKLGKTMVVNTGHGRDAQVLIEINDKTKKFKINFVESLMEKYKRK